MLSTFKEIKGKAENLDRELEIIKRKHSRSENTITKIKTSRYELNSMLKLKNESITEIQKKIQTQAYREPKR